MIMKVKIFSLAISIFFLTTACSKDKETEELTNHNIPEEQGRCITSYESEIKSILDDKCTFCHGGAYYPDLTGYQNAKQWGERIKVRAVINGNMPPAGNVAGELNEIEKQAIECWLELGSPR